MSLKIQEFFNNGVLEGERKIFYNNSQIFTQEFYINGKLEGEYKVWRRDGKLLDYSFYIAGIEIDPIFNIFKRYKWIKTIRNLKFKVNLRYAGPVLDELNIPLDIAKLCCKYY